MSNKIEIFSLNKKFEKLEKDVGSVVQKILKILKKDGLGVEVYLADNNRMRLLNKKFRGKDKAANVLSFEEPWNFIYPPRQGKVQKTKKIGEIYLNADQCGLDMEQLGKSQRESVFSQYQSVLLVVHGLLHLLGYDHGKKDDRMRMEKKEKEILLKYN